MTDYKEVLAPTKTFQTGMDILVGHTVLEDELGKALGVSKATIARLRYEGKIPYVKISSGKPIYLVESILAWLKKKEVNEGIVDPEEAPPSEWKSIHEEGSVENAG